MTNARAARIAENVSAVRSRIAAAAVRSGRDANDVSLVAVTKYVGLPEIEALIASGCYDLGESRPQSLWEKAAALSHTPVRWHLIGHLQRNKIRRTIPHLYRLHSGDSLRLLSEVDQEALTIDHPLDVLLEINISGDLTKHGFSSDELFAAAAQAAKLPRVRVRGLMAMSGLESNTTQTRQQFAAVRMLLDELNSRSIFPGKLTELSMGMSDDYESAILEGATMVRVGSALFEGLDV